MGSSAQSSASHHENWRLLHDEHGNAAVPGFYDDATAPEKWELRRIDAITAYRSQYAEFLGVPEFHSATDTRRLAIRFCPTLNSMGWGRLPRRRIKDRFLRRLLQNYLSSRFRPKLRRHCRKSQTCLDACPSAVRCEVEVKGGRPHVWFPRANQVLPARDDLMRKAFSVAESCIEDGFGTKPIYPR